ncbi:hypothetical protein SDC49_25865 [Lactobacillus sp. R2/2]|nr:hypothetical protein [Lactobacillus sp. R2/2]
MNNPKYDWHTHEWVEQDATSNSYRLNDVEQKIESLQKRPQTLVKIMITCNNLCLTFLKAKKYNHNN